MIIATLFLKCHIVISYIRIKNTLSFGPYALKILRSDKLDIKNSPLDHLATLAARVIFCAKGTCGVVQPVALSLGFMLGADEVIKAGGKEPIFSPFLAKIFIPKKIRHS